MDGQRVEATPATKSKRWAAADRPNRAGGHAHPDPSKHKNPLDVWEIDGRGVRGQAAAAARIGQRLFLFSDHASARVRNFT